MASPALLAPAPPARPVVDRVRGIDMARALAILGMVMVHFGPFEPDDGTLAGQVYATSGGRASVLFVLLAGVGVSLLGRSRSVRDARIRLAWRAVVFFPLGVVLQALPTPVAVILQFYALYYLLGAAVMALPTRVLVALTGVWTAVGPLVFLAVVGPEFSGRGTASSLSDPVSVVADLLVTGYYPLLTWAPPLLVGVLVGRVDLRDTTTRWILLAGGAAVAITAYGGSAIGLAVAPAADPWLISEGHSGAPLNVIGATAVAVAVLAACLLLASWLPRLTWPLVAVGQMALTVYVTHLVVLAVGPTLLEDRADVVGAAVKVARFFLVTTVLCALWRSRFARGPLEWLLAAPFQGADRRRLAAGSAGWPLGEGAPVPGHPPPGTPGTPARPPAPGPDQPPWPPR